MIEKVVPQGLSLSFLSGVYLAGPIINFFEGENYKRFVGLAAAAGGGDRSRQRRGQSESNCNLISRISRLVFLRITRNVTSSFPLRLLSLVRVQHINYLPSARWDCQVGLLEGEEEESLKEGKLLGGDTC